MPGIDGWVDQVTVSVVIALVVWLACVRYYCRDGGAVGAVAQASIRDFTPDLIIQHRVPYIIEDGILPQFYENLCFEDVIIMSFTPSRRIRDAKDRMPYPERQQLAIRLMDTFIAQLVVHGVMHGDPHEGNLGLSEDGRIVLYDLGNVLSVDRATRLKLRRLLLDILSGNLDDALALMRTIDLFEIRDDVRVRLLLEKYAEYIRTVDINVVLSSSVAKEMQGNLPIKFKSVVFRIIRVFGLLEGICKDIDPKFSYEPIMAKYMQVLSGDGEYMTYRAFSDLRKVVAVLLGPQT